MAFPTGWPPRASSGRRSIRFYAAGTTTADFDDNALLFADGLGANTFLPTPYLAPGSLASVAVGSAAASGSPMGAGAPLASAPAPNSPQTAPVAQIWAQTISVLNLGAGTLEISFDGTNVHGSVLANERRVFRDRYESGIALRGRGMVTPAYEVDAW